MPTIKKGTYRFNSLLDSCGFTQFITENIEFYNTLVYTVNEEDLPDIKEDLGIEISAGVYKLNRKCGGLCLSFNADNRYRNWVDYNNVKIISVEPYLESFESFIGREQDFDIVYDSWNYPYDYYTEVDGNEYWGSVIEQGDNIITITHDQDVTDEFYTWFTANAKPVIKAGTYKFNDVLTNAYDVPEFNAWHIKIPFHTDVTSASYGTHRAYCDQLYFYFNDDAGNEFVESSFNVVSCDILEQVGHPLPSSTFVYVEGSWKTEYGEGIQTITITEDTAVSAEFYNWFAENAVEQDVTGTWVFNANPTNPMENGQSVFFDCGFTYPTSSGNVRQGVKIGFYDEEATDVWGIYYVRLDDDGNEVNYLPYKSYSGWGSDIVRTITITENPTDAAFIAWLKANAKRNTAISFPSPMGKHSVTITDDILLGAGVYLKNLTFDGTQWTGEPLGATSGGGKISIKDDLVDLAVDGSQVKTKGLTVKQGGSGTMEINYIELSPELLKIATNFTDELVDKARVEEGDYVSNFGFVGYTVGGQEIIIIFEAALCTSGLEIEAKDKETSIIKLTLEAVADDVTLLPIKIYRPSKWTGVWKFKDTLTLVDFNADFEFSYYKESTGVTRNCVGLICIDGVLTYSSSEFNDGHLEVYYDGAWRDDYYKTITITKEPTDDAVKAWLKENAEYIPFSS